MASVTAHSDHHHQHAAAHHGPKAMPTTLNSPELLATWKMRALIVFGVAALLSLIFALPGIPIGRTHILRAYLMGFMTTFNLAGGALVMLMLQYVTGGKWGLLLRRPLEAMTRTLPYVALGFIPIGLLAPHLYQWAEFPNSTATAHAYAIGVMTKEQQLTANLKHAMFSPLSATIQTIAVFTILCALMFTLNRWSLRRDQDADRNTMASYDRWRIKFENLSGPGIFIYVVLLTDAALLWIMSLDVTWYSSIWGLQFLVAQGFGVLAVCILTVVRLSKVEPMKTLLRATEQHDLGKFAFAFVMLNMYLTFAEFLIIWSGNVPDEIPWYLARIRGGWWYVCFADFCCHWLIPFCLLLSRNLKRDKRRLTALCIFMVFARLLDMFWLIEPNFKDAAANLHLAGNIGLLAYLTVPVAVLAAWSYVYLTELGKRPLIAINDSHLSELLEPDHAH